MITPISIVIRTFNSEKILPNVLSKLHLTGDDEIIIVDSGSRDSTLDIAQKFNCKILKLTPPFNYSKALNVGFTTAKNNWVLSLSSHCLPISPRYLDEWRDAISTFPNGVAAAFGPALLTAGTLAKINDSVPRQYRRVKDWQQYQQYLAGNSNALYRKHYWQEYPFNENLNRSEDWDWLIHAEQKQHLTVLVPNAAVLYRNQGSLRYMFLKGFKDGQITRKMIAADKLSIFNLCIACASTAKKYLWGQIPFGTLLRQNAHVIGFFWGSRR